MEGANPSPWELTEPTEPPFDPRSLPPLFEAPKLSIFAVTLVEAPAFVRRLGLLRSDAYSGLGPWNYGLDAYDEHAVQIVALEPGDDDPVGALRVAPGDVIVNKLGLDGLYLQRFFEFGPGASEFFKGTVEYGRVWVTPKHPRSLFILHSLLQALGAFVARRGEYHGICGTVSLLDFPSVSRARVASYLRRYHPWEDSFLDPRFSVTEAVDGAEAKGDASRLQQAEAFRCLVRELRGIDKAHRLPPSLHIYLRHGARLLGDVALDKSGRKILIPLYLSRRSFLSELETTRALTNGSALSLDRPAQGGS